MVTKTTNKVPQHVVLFLDGNRRWAREQGLDTLEGHRVGYEKAMKFCEWCVDRGVKVITAFGFSTENWNRSKREVLYLMNLLRTGLLENFTAYSKDSKLKNLGIRVQIMGQKERLPKLLRRAIEEVEEGTKHNNKLILNLSVSYGGRWDIVQATQRIIKEGIPAEKVTEELFSKYIATAGLPEPDLIIRPGGEKRLSNFVLWQAAYAELYFCDKYWPAFTEQDLDDAFAEYARRQRRYGK
ncbi:di-trans,poly-cis-decaprenylcistransferase [Patescibacteria group bacterium]|nr:di-trans,poly-cis-decaprenylcistransferase [Patescibacteria group bacterium]